MSPQRDGSAHLELTGTALKLSKVIEREAKRHSAMHSTAFLRVQSHFPSFSRPKLQQSQRSQRSQHSQRSRRSVSVTPTPEEESAITEENSNQPISKGAIPRQGSATAETATEFKSLSDDPVNAGRGGILLQAWLFFEDPQSSIPAYYFSLVVYGFVIISTFTFIVETEAAFDPYTAALNYIETLCAAVFSFELVARLLVCPSKIAFIRNYSNWIDVIAVFPYYLERLMAVDHAASFGAIRIVRLTRVARVLKMSRYSSAIQVFTQAIAISIKPLTMLIFLMSIAMIIFSSAIYFAEYTVDGCRVGGWMGDCEMDSSGNVNTTTVTYSETVAAAIAAVSASKTCVCVDPNPYQGIATSFWWCIVTMSTVGYGDMTPVTWLGKTVGCCTVLTGMLVLALPITVIGTNFQKVMKSVMHETMKGNVDYLKGKRMLCRNEIEAILERFHAVTEGIHLDIDDIINVYDTDNSGMLEDDELAKFRNDLEVLQNRAFLNQLVVPGVGLQQHRGSSTARLRSGSVAAAPASTEILLQNKAVRIDKLGHRVPIVPLPQAIRRTSLGAPTTQSNDVGATPDSGPPSEAVGMARVPSVAMEMFSQSSSISAASQQLGENELMFRLLEMQESFNDRLLETEQRLEVKIGNLTKILMRLEGMMEQDD